jgi:hypothetical protein
MSVFPRRFCFIAFPGVSQRWEFKNTTKNVLQNNRVEKVPRMVSFFPFFIVFLNSPHRETPKNVIKKNKKKSVRGVQKHDKKWKKN